MIKSEKAKADVELLQRQLTLCELNDVRFGVEDHKESRAYKIGKDIESCVIQAESDARKRAVRALRKSCADNENGYCTVSRVIGDDGYPTTMFCGYKCDTVKCFLKHYDQ